MTNKKLLILLSVIAVTILVGFMAFGMMDNSKDNSSETATNTIDSAPVENEQPSDDQIGDVETVTYGSEQVAEKSTASECWTIIDGKVYNITEYISMHPGGNEIERACGIDATSLFNNRTTTDGEEVGSGTPHSSSANSSLRQYYIGDLR